MGAGTYQEVPQPQLGDDVAVETQAFVCCVGVQEGAPMSKVFMREWKSGLSS